MSFRHREGSDYLFEHSEDVDKLMKDLKVKSGKKASSYPEPELCAEEFLRSLPPPGEKFPKISSAAKLAEELQAEEFLHDKEEADMKAAQTLKSTLNQCGLADSAEEIMDLSVPSNERLRCSYTFQMGNGYFIFLGPVPFYNQGGSFDAFQVGRVLQEKEGGKVKQVTLNMPVKLLPPLEEGLSLLLEKFDSGRSRVSGANIHRLIKKADGGKVDLSRFAAFKAPNTICKLDANHYIGGETVTLPKGNSYEAITFIRVGKKDRNGSSGSKGGDGKFKFSVPLRLLPILQATAHYAVGVCGLGKKERKNKKVGTDSARSITLGG